MPGKFLIFIWKMFYIEEVTIFFLFSITLAYHTKANFTVIYLKEVSVILQRKLEEKFKS